MAKKAKPKKEVGTKHPELHEIIESLDGYRQQLMDDPKCSSTRFNHMQTALHFAKQLIRIHYGAPTEKRAIAWVK